MQLRVQDAMKKIQEVESSMKGEIESLRNDFDKSLSTIMGKLNEISVGLGEDQQQTKGGCKCSNDKYAEIVEKVESVRNDLIGHVMMYNNHIIQQHNRR